MTITGCPDTREWHLHNGSTSWVLAVLENGWLGHLHAGAPLDAGASHRHLALPFAGFDNRVGEPVGLALPGPGVGDFRVPGLVVETPDGATILDPCYAGHRILAGKPGHGGLPATYAEADAEADTLEVDLVDAVSGVAVTVSYTLFAAWPVVARSMCITNDGAGPVTVRAAMSATLDLPDAAWTMVQLSGTWARERIVVERPLVRGRQGISSLRGASGSEHNPFLALRRAATTEEAGEAWGVVLAYTGNFLAEVDVEPFGTARLRIGINPEAFSWRLAPGETFRTPEAVLAWSDRGMGGVSEALHGLFRTRLARGMWRDADRPVLLNSWEGTHFDFDHERLVAMARQARGPRHRAVRSRRRLVRGARRRHARAGRLDGEPGEAPARAGGAGSGGPRSRDAVRSLDRARDGEPGQRPLPRPPGLGRGYLGRRRTESRHQHVLDLANPAVVDHLFGAMTAILDRVPVDYVKWDWNRFRPSLGRPSCRRSARASSSIATSSAFTTSTSA